MPLAFLLEPTRSSPSLWLWTSAQGTPSSRAPIRSLPPRAASHGSAPHRSSSILIPRRTIFLRPPWSVIWPRNVAAEKTDSCGSPQGKIVRAIVPVHLFGLCCEMDAIHAISERFQLDVIEDAAQAIGAEYPFGGKTAKAGTMGEIGYFSFYPSKNLGAAGDAGMVICRDDAFAQRLRVCRQHGMEPRYFHHFVGGNFRLDEMQAAILGVKLPFLDGWSAARRAVADVYREEFKRLGLTNRPFDSRRTLPGSRPDQPPHLSPICHPHSAAGRASRPSDAQGNRHGHLLSAWAARAKVLRLPRLSRRETSRKPNAPREKLWPCRSIRNYRAKRSATSPNRSRSFSSR